MDQEILELPATIRIGIQRLLPDLEKIYIDLHAHPELSMQENRTSAMMADRLRDYGFDVTTDIGQTGVVGILRNGTGPTVMLRADLDALPVKEETGLSFASCVTTTDRNGNNVPVMHACGHDLHMTWLLGAANLLSESTDLWKGTLMVVFQPGEETAEGARAMIDDGLFSRFPRPDVILGQHLMNTPAGEIGWRPGVIMSSADSIQIKLFGRGGHGAMPEASIDPVVMAASIVLRLQTIVSRELSVNEPAVLTIGSLQAGTKENIIPDDAILKVNVRTFDTNVRQRVLSAIERIVNAEAEASGAMVPPEFKVINQFPMVINDPEATDQLIQAFRKYIPSNQLLEVKPIAISEDFGAYSQEYDIPSVFWFIGGTDPEIYTKAKLNNRLAEIPTNHSSHFLPVLIPTLETGVKTFIIGVLSWLSIENTI